MLSTFRNSCWSPAVSTAGAGILIFFVLPSIALMALNSRSTMLGLIGLGCLVFPFLISKFHRISPLLPTLAFYSIMTTAWFSRPEQFDGNAKLAFANYLIPWLIAALAAVGLIATILVRGNTRGK